MKLFLIVLSFSASEAFLNIKHYSEAQAAESPDDFIHKLRVVLKELKECRTSLRVIIKKAYIKPISKLDGIYKETEELIAIIGKSISTAEKNRSKGKD